RDRERRHDADKAALQLAVAISAQVNLPTRRRDFDRRRRLALENAREQPAGGAIVIAIDALDLAGQRPLDLRHHALGDSLDYAEIVGMEIDVIDAGSQRAERKRIQVEPQ